MENQEIQYIINVNLISLSKIRIKKIIGGNCHIHHYLLIFMEQMEEKWKGEKIPLEILNLHKVVKIIF